MDTIINRHRQVSALQPPSALDPGEAATRYKQMKRATLVLGMMLVENKVINGDNKQQ